MSDFFEKWKLFLKQTLIDDILFKVYGTVLGFTENRTQDHTINNPVSYRYAITEPYILKFMFERLSRYALHIRL